MQNTDLDDFIPPAPSMQAPGAPFFEGQQWGGGYPQEGNALTVARLAHYFGLSATVIHFTHKKKHKEFNRRHSVGRSCLLTLTNVFIALLIDCAVPTTSLKKCKITQKI